MRSPQTTGDDHPRPGIVVLHATLSVVLHVSGRPEASTSPEECGPRNCGQLSSARAMELTRVVRAIHRMSMIEVIDSGSSGQASALVGVPIPSRPQDRSRESHDRFR